MEALEELRNLGVQRILTSGQQPTVWEGREMIKELIEKANGKIIILGGSGINAANVSNLVAYTGLKEVHLTGKKIVKSKPDTKVQSVKFNNFGYSENDYYETDVLQIRRVVKLLQSFNKNF